MDALTIISAAAPIVTIVAVAAIGGWVFTTWLRIKNGYPLDGAWGQALHPRTDRDSAERMKLLSSENAQLRAELGSVKDRLETIERIVTDQPHRLAHEIDALGTVPVAAPKKDLA
jgi:hypothetical protein